jgi:NADH-quinone oxidoreductase subunit J
MEIFIFYFMYFLVIVSALGVVLSPNPVHAILFLVLVFLDSSALLVLTGSEFLGLVLVVVYVGAVAVLFLFICMMLDIRVKEQFEAWVNISYIPLGAFLLISFLTLVSPIIYGFVPDFLGFSSLLPEYVDWSKVITTKQNIVAIGSVLYSVFVLYFILSSYILLLAMVGSISLTLWKRLDSKRQSIYYQVTRDATRSRVLVPSNRRV